jgi:hypothetical protein
VLGDWMTLFYANRKTLKNLETIHDCVFPNERDSGIMMPRRRKRLL